MVYMRPDSREYWIVTMPEKIILLVDNVHTRILGHYPHRAVDEATSFLMPGCWFTPAYKAKRWDGRVRLLNWKTSSFPTGLLKDVERILQHTNYEYNKKDQRNIPDPKSIRQIYQIPKVHRSISGLNGETETIVVG